MHYPVIVDIWRMDIYSQNGENIARSRIENRFAIIVKVIKGRINIDFCSNYNIIIKSIFEITRP